MKLKFTKMHGAGNDFIVLDGYRAPLALSAAQVRALADRRFGIGADQVLLVEKPTLEGVDFRYRIFNCDGGEVEHCGNGARCFVRFVRERGLTDARRVRVQVQKGVIVLTMQDNGEVVVDMGSPTFDPARVPFDARGLTGRREGRDTLWPLDMGARVCASADAQAGCAVPVKPSERVDTHAGANADAQAHMSRAASVAASEPALADTRTPAGHANSRSAHAMVSADARVCAAYEDSAGAGMHDDAHGAATSAPHPTRWISVVSMGNPHAVQVVDDVAAYPVSTEGLVVEAHPRFAQKVNAGFMQIVSRHAVKLRVYERGAGETLACGTGACAAVAAGIRRGLLDTPVSVHTRGGVLTIAWDGARDEAAPLTMAGPAVTVFEGEIALDDLPDIAGDGGPTSA